MTDQDWRKSAYLRKENWPEAIPNCGPKREYGPYPWSRPTHDPEGLDTYHYHHPAAAGIGDLYMGDVCPQCGVPLKYDESVITINGSEGVLHEVSPSTDPVPCYHKDCHAERRAELNESLLAYNE